MTAISSSQRLPALQPHGQWLNKPFDRASAEERLHRLEQILRGTQRDAPIADRWALPGQLALSTAICAFAYGVLALMPLAAGQGSDLPTWTALTVMVTGVLTAAFPRLMSRDQHAPLSRWLHRAFGLGLAIIGWTQLP